jgi:transposase
MDKKSVTVASQDNAPYHVSARSREFFASNNIELFWPSSSPDMSPIKNLCSALKTRLRKYAEINRRFESRGAMNFRAENVQNLLFHHQIE